jgi:glycolate oxidase
MPLGGELVARLRLICGDSHVLADPAALAPYRSDAQRRHRQLPPVAVLPGSAVEVASVVRACADAGAPFVARGAGTGLAGGAVPIADAVLLVLSRMRQIVAVDLDDGVLVAEAGASARAIARALAPSHFLPCLPSGDAATIGGIVATNAGGPRSLKYGPIRRHLAGLDIVLPDGRQVNLRPPNLGYDLLGTFAGSEGTLGVATAVHLRVLPAPPDVRTAVAYFDDVVAAADAAAAILAAGIEPVALELLDARVMAISAQATGVGLVSDPPGPGAALLIELDGSHEQCDADEAALSVTLTKARTRNLRVAHDAPERALLWRAHTAALAGLGRAANAFSVQDPAVPPSTLAALLQRVRKLAGKSRLDVILTARAGEGIIHPIVLYDARVPGEATQAQELSDAITDACIDAGGTITAEHGVGIAGEERLQSLFSTDDLDAFDRLHAAFDPGGLANPGRAAAGLP